MPSNNTTSPKKPLSGAAQARRRVEQGLPRYSEKTLAARARAIAKRAKIYPKIRHAERIAITNAIKLEHGCADCGFRAHPAALQFDHLPGSVKVGTIATLRYLASLPVLMAEIAKCEVVCANCHAIRTARRREKIEL